MISQEENGNMFELVILILKKKDLSIKHHLNLPRINVDLKNELK